MSVNLLELVQVKMGYPALQKIDPSIQELVWTEDTADEHRFSQAGIPAVLTGLYVFSRTDENAEKILQQADEAIWVNTIFSDTADEVVEKVAAYSFSTKENAAAKMNSIANSAVEIMKENLPEERTVHDVKEFFVAQRNIILSYLPPALHMGVLLKDNTLDDQIHKMEGPISSLMHAIGDSFSDGEVKENEVNGHDQS